MSVGEADLDAEQEVDLGRYWSAIVARWWLPVLGFVAGAFIGYLISLGGKDVWKASATAYLGASYSSVGGVFLQGPQANPATAGADRARGVVDRGTAAAQAGMRAGDLRGHVSTQAISTGAGTTAVRTTGNPLVPITVQASTRRRAQAAANALAGASSSNASRRTRTRKSRRCSNALPTIRCKLTPRPAWLVLRRRAHGKAVLAVQIGDVLDDQLQAKQLLIQAQEIEHPEGPDPRGSGEDDGAQPAHSVVVGAFLGLAARPDRRARVGTNHTSTYVVPLPSDARRPLARDHAAPESTLALAKAPSLGRGRARPLAWCSRPRDSTASLAGALMLEGRTVAVVIPAFDEEALVATTIQGVPDFVDRIIVVDDASHDGTAAAARAAGDGRVEVITHQRNSGVGAAIVTGYQQAVAEGLDVACVMAADNQMEPADLEKIALPVVRGEVEYAKANRLITGEAWKVIPRSRYLGNAVLSLLTKIT